MILDIKNSIKELSDDAIDDLKGFILTQQSSDGGFLGRDNKSDIYYTVFGIQLALAFNVKLKFDILKYLNNIEKNGNLDFIHLTSLLRSYELLNCTPLNRDNILQSIEKYRTENGGYNHLGKGMDKGNVYAPFLVSLLEGKNSLPEKQNQIINSLNCCKKDDGSYGNDPNVLSGSTTATSAAISLLSEYNEPIETKSFELLYSRADNDGGFLAGDSAPIPDLLSTATAIFAISKCKNFPLANTDKHKEFISSLWNENGGFSGHIMDGVSDCEYTFYAMLALANFRSVNLYEKL